MSARGARSRKAVAKDIEKKEKKSVEKGKAIESVRRPEDAFAEWRPTPSNGSRDTGLPPSSYTVTISGNASRATSRSSSSNPTGNGPRLHTINSNESLGARGINPRRTSISGSASISGSSTTSKEKAKYQAKGKETKAPRGRGGGVPVKKPAGISPTSPIYRSTTSASSRPSPNGKTWINFRIWEGGEAGLKPYAGFEFDEYMQDGDVLVYFKEEQGSEDRPTPQIRADLDVLENSGSTWLSNALMYGRIDDNEDDWTLPDSPESSRTPQNLASPNFPQAPPQRRMLSPTSPGGISPPPFNIDSMYTDSAYIDSAYYGVPGHGTASGAQYYSALDRPGGTQSPLPFQQNRQNAATHELWFTAPAHIRTPQGQRLHHVAVRNFLAMLHNKPIVGADLFEMLSTLQPEIQVMFDLDHDNQSTVTPRERSVQMITTYLNKQKLDDVRNSIKVALGLLAWAEQDNVRWRQGYIESFVHLAGIMSPQLEDLPDFKRLSIVTRRNLGIAGKTLQLRIMEAEEKLSAFDFSELWGDEEVKGPGTPVHQSYQAFRQFLISYYTKIYGNWPPTQGKTWLNRKMVLGLQEDFGALYDYLVNRDVIWDPREERPGKKWEMVNRKSEEFRADTAELSMTDMLVTFDNRHGYLHIPNPYPLLPREVPGQKKTEKKSFFGGLKKTKTDTTKDAKAHLQLSIVFSDATNIEKLDGSFNGSALIDAFERFELSTALTSTSPREARLGRWLLLYGTLQVLSTLSVDVQNLKWTEGVRYFLCTDLKRCPEWVTNAQAEYFEASQLRSWCWQRPWNPTPMSGAPAELEGQSVPIGGELDGQERGIGMGMPLNGHDRHMPMPMQMSMPPREGERRLESDIRRISEKIDGLGMAGRREFELRRENEKVKHEDMKRLDDSYRVAEREYAAREREGEREMEAQRPMVPPRSPMRAAAAPQGNAFSQRGYFAEDGGQGRF